MGREIIISRYDSNGFPTTLAPIYACDQEDESTIPSTLDEDDDSTYYFCGRTDFSTDIGSYIYRTWGNHDADGDIKTDEEHDALEHKSEQFFLNILHKYKDSLKDANPEVSARNSARYDSFLDTDFMCPHLTFVLASEEKVHSMTPEELRAIGVFPDTEFPPLSIASLNSFLEKVVAPHRNRDIANYEHMNKVIEAGWVAAKNAKNLNDFIEFVEYLSDQEEDNNPDEVLNGPASVCYNIITSIMREYKINYRKMNEHPGVLRVFVSD